MIKKAVWSQNQKRFSHKSHERFGHSGLVTLYSKFDYIFAIKPKCKKGNFSTVFNNILFHYTPHLANNET